MARVEGTLPGVTYSLDQFVLQPGTGDANNSPNTANPNNDEFNLNIRVDHGEGSSSDPWIAANMETVCFSHEDVLNYSRQGVLAVLSQFRPIEERIEAVRRLNETEIDLSRYPDAAVRGDGRPLYITAVGYRDSVQHAHQLYQAGSPGIRVDSANGYTPGFQGNIREIKKNRDEMRRTIGGIRDFANNPLQLWAGNVGTPEGIYRLADAGADTVLVGLGSGTGCGTAFFIGVHVPQFTALHECSIAAKEKNVGIVGDGGVRNPWTAGVALTFATKGIMMGSVFAACEESPAEKKGNKAHYYGSASDFARKRRASIYHANYKYDPNDPIEGFDGWIPVRGTIEQAIAPFNRTLMEQLYYVGAHNLQEFRDYATLRYLSTGAYMEVMKPYINGQ